MTNTNSVIHPSAKIGKNSVIGNFCYIGEKVSIGENCIVMNHLEEYYPAGVKEFKHMVQKNGIEIPVGICSGLTNAQFDQMIDVSLGMKPLWENALGKNFRT